MQQIQTGRLPQIGLGAVGITNHLTKAIADVVDEAIQARLFPGCVIGIIKQNEKFGRDQDDIFQTKMLLYGNTTYDLFAPKMTEDSLFDIASITKTFTAMMALKLIDEGRLSLDTKVKDILDISGPYSDEMTVEHLLTFTVELDLTEEASVLWKMNVEEILRAVLTSGSKYPPGTHHQYRNSTTLLLGMIIEEVTGYTLERYMHTELFSPFGMNRTLFHPKSPTHFLQPELSQIVPTEYDGLYREELIYGDVHDELSWKFFKEGKKCIGVAGVFSPLSDIMMFSQMILRGCQWGGKKFFTNRPMNETKFLGYQMRQNQIRHLKDHQYGFGWDKLFPNYVSCNCFVNEAIITTGFTGCSIMLHSEKGFGLVILSNTVHPTRQDHEAMRQFRRRIANLAIFCKHCHD